MDKYIPILENLRKAVGPNFNLCIEKFPWDIDTIINKLCPVLEDLKFYWYEEPFEFNVPDVVGKLLAIKAAMPSVMVSGGENCWNRYQLEPFMNSGAMDIVQSDTNYTGITEGWYIGQNLAKYGRKYVAVFTEDRGTIEIPIAIEKDTRSAFFWQANGQEMFISQCWGCSILYRIRILTAIKRRVKIG
jgi:L-alanine-DL-glutamate epimerase-like enolase superfamily enzyme